MVWKAHYSLLDGLSKALATTYSLNSRGPRQKDKEKNKIIAKPSKMAKDPHNCRFTMRMSP